MEEIMDAIRAIRTRRSEMNVAPGRKVQLTIATAKGDVFTAGAPFFKRLAGATEVHVVPAAEAPASKGQVEVVTHSARVLGRTASSQTAEATVMRDRAMQKARSRVKSRFKFFISRSLLSLPPRW